MSVDWGSVPDWFSAVGTVGAVIFTLKASYWDNRPKMNVSLDIEYKTPDMDLIAYRVIGINDCEKTVNINQIGIDFGKVQRNHLLHFTSNTYDGMLKNGDDIQAGISPIDFYNQIKKYNLKSKSVKVRGFIADNLGNKYYGKWIEYDLKLIQEEAKTYQSKYSNLKFEIPDYYLVQTHKYKN